MPQISHAEFQFRSSFMYLYIIIELYPASIIHLAPTTPIARFHHLFNDISAKNGFTNATDAADYLVKINYHSETPMELLASSYCSVSKNISLDDMTLEEYKAISPVFEKDIYEAISMKTCVEKRLTIGAPGSEAMNMVITICEEYLK